MMQPGQKEFDRLLEYLTSATSLRLSRDDYEVISMEFSATFFKILYAGLMPQLMDYANFLLAQDREQRDESKPLLALVSRNT